MSTNPDWTQQPPAPKKGGTGKTLLIILGVVGGLVVLACCGIGGGIYYFARNLVTTDPATIETRKAEVLDITIPAEFKPVMAMNIPSVMKMVVYSNQTDQSGVFLAEMGSAMAGANEEQFRAQMQQSMQQQGQGQGPQAIQIKETNTRQVAVRGQPTDFNFAKGTNSNGTEFWQVSGIVQGKSGRVMVMLNLPAATWDEAKIDALLQTIQ